MMVNATGWALLMQGKLILAAFELFDTALMGWTIGILFLVYQFMLYMKTRNLTLTFTMGIIFASLYGLSTFLTTASVYIMWTLLILELAGVFYFIIVK